MVHSTYQLGQMGILNNPNLKRTPKKFLCLSSVTCDEMIKIPCVNLFLAFFSLPPKILKYKNIFPYSSYM